MGLFVKGKERERKRKSVSKSGARSARKTKKRLRKMSRLGEKGVKIQKNWSLMVSFVRLCASTEPTTQTRKVRHQNTLWERMRSYRLISQTPAVFAACPVFKSHKNQNVFKRVSLNPKRDDFERGNETMLRNTLSFALFISQHEALLLCVRTIRRAKRALLSSKTTTRNKSSYLSPYAHRPDHSLTLSLSLKMTNESSLCFPFKTGNAKP